MNGQFSAVEGMKLPANNDTEQNPVVPKEQVAKKRFSKDEIDALFAPSEPQEELRAEVGRIEKEDPQMAAKIEAQAAELAFLKLSEAINSHRQSAVQKLRDRLVREESPNMSFEELPISARAKINVKVEDFIRKGREDLEDAMLSKHLTDLLGEMSKDGKEAMLEGNAGRLFAGKLLESQGVSAETVAYFREPKEYLPLAKFEGKTELTEVEQRERDVALIENSRIAEREMFMAVMQTEPERVPALIRRMRTQDALRAEIVAEAEEKDAGKSGGSQYVTTLEGGAGYYKSAKSNIEAAKNVREGKGYREGCPPATADVRVAAVDMFVTALGYEKFTAPVVLIDGPNGRGSLQESVDNAVPLDVIRRENFADINALYDEVDGLRESKKNLVDGAKILETDSKINKKNMMAKAAFAQKLAETVDLEQWQTVAAIHHAYGETDGNAGNILVNRDLVTGGTKRIAIIDTANGFSSMPAADQSALKKGSADPLMSIAADGLSYGSVGDVIPPKVVGQFEKFLNNQKLTKAMEQAMVNLLDKDGVKAWEVTKARLAEMVASGHLVSRAQIRMAAT